jgi:hypothetical protein
MNQQKSSLPMFKVGGSLPFNDPTYISRNADDMLYDGLSTGELCYVFNCRQVGKTSIAVKIIHQLKKNHIPIYITFQKIQFNSLEDLCRVIFEQIVKTLKQEKCISADFNDNHWWDHNKNNSHLNCLDLFFQDIAIQSIEKNIVIIFDEIDKITDLKSDADQFFGWIRSCSEEKNINSSYQKITFCLIGVISVSDLIKNPDISPFNIGKAIQLSGFTFEECSKLGNGLTGIVNNSEQALKRVLYWTNGQPLLTQRICQLVLDNNTYIDSGEETEIIDEIVIKNIINNWRDASNQTHLTTIEERIKSENNLICLDMYERILSSGDQGIDADNSDAQVRLLLSGLVLNNQGKLKVYNPIYRKVFNEEWLKRKQNNLRPYGTEFNDWCESDCQDENYLLEGEELSNAQNWAKDKFLTPEDHKFLNGSNEKQNKLILSKKETQFEQQLNERETQFEQQLNKRETQFEKQLNERETQFEQQLNKRETQFEKQLNERETQFEKQLNEREQKYKTKLLKLSTGFIFVFLTAISLSFLAWKTWKNLQVTQSQIEIEQEANAILQRKDLGQLDSLIESLKNVQKFKNLITKDTRVSSSQSGLTKGVKNSHHIIIIHGSPFTFLTQTALEGFFLIQNIESHAP